MLKKSYIFTVMFFEPNNSCAVLNYVKIHFQCNTRDLVDPGYTRNFPVLTLPIPGDDGNNDLPDEDGPYNENDRKPIWWYHSDHLGSSTYLTDNFGRPSHYYETLPFGEMMVEHNQSANNGVGYDNKYKFNGKELDDATGMYYYGARYYDPRISIFVSVDPLAEQTMEPYSYVSNNPINLIDPTGMSAEGPHDPPGGEDEGTVLPELIIDKRDLHQKMEDASGSNLSYGGEFYEHRRQLERKREVAETYQRIQGYRDMGIWDDNKEYDNWAHAVGSQLTLVMPSARFAGFFNAFSKSKDVVKTNMTTVGRWMSRTEYDIMAKTGRMVEGAGGQTFVSKGGSEAFNAAVKGSVYVEFQVPANSLLQGGKANWFKVIGPNASKAMQGKLQSQGGELLPQIQNLSPILRVK